MAYNTPTTSVSELIGQTSGIVSGSTPGMTNETWLGNLAGDNGGSTDVTTFIGASAGDTATNAGGSTFVGSESGKGATDAADSVFYGFQSGLNAVNASNSLFLGFAAGSGATNAQNSIFIGNATGVNDTVDNTGGSTSIVIGNGASTGGNINSIVIGNQGQNTLPNQFLVPISYTEVSLGRMDGGPFQGLSLSAANNSVLLGTNNGIAFTIDGVNAVSTINSAGTPGLSLDFTNEDFVLGNKNTNTYLDVNGGTGNVNAFIQSGANSFQVLDNGNSGLPAATFGTSLSQIGDIAFSGTGTVFNVDPIGGLIESHVSSQFNVFDATTHKYISIDPSGGNSFFGPFSVSGLDQGLWVDTNAQINSLKSPGGTNITNTLGDIYFGVDITNKKLLMPNTIIESVDAEPYGSTINLVAGMAGENMVTFGPSGGGASTINLPTGTNADVGTRFTASDLGGAVAANNVTIDAGTGNTITGPGGTAQTFILNTNGTSVTLIKATSTKWMII